jgi:hypothetical protein
VKLSQELSEPGRLSHAVSNSPVLRPALERHTIGCRLDDQEIRLSPSKTT